MKKHYFVFNKGDDYGNCKRELVETTKKNVKKYYHHKQIEDEDLDALKKYFSVVSFEEENERTDEERYYGN